METQSYVSCIKLNGVPILPPMMTKDIIEETNYYKQMAIEVEKRLAALRVAKQSNTIRQTGKEKRKSKGMKLIERVFSLDHDLVNARTESPTDVKLMTQAPMNASEPFVYPDKETDSCKEDLNKGAEWKTYSDEDNGFESETRATPGAASRSESVATSADLSHGLNDTLSNTTDTTPETCKPQVPKTLDIVPLTLDNSMYTRNNEKGVEEENNSRGTPKLVRQGSYVLDTPSPMLLAHMHLELANGTDAANTEYVPTTAMNTVKRKEWNIAQAKMEWEYSTKDKGNSKQARNSQEERKSKKTIQKPDKFESFDNHNPARSVDCIQAMLAKEYIDRNRPKTSHEQRYSISQSSSCEKSQKYDKWKNHNLPKKFGGSLGNLDNVCTATPKCAEYGTRMVVSNGVEEESVSKKEEIRDLTTKLKSSITTDKLLTVYKEIQTMHEKQMSELVTRQQKEQLMLQKEFERQQLLLLTEIKKSFPIDPVPMVADNAQTADFSEMTEEETVRHSHLNALPEQSSSNIIKRSRSPRMDRANTISCPLDYIYPRDEIPEADVYSIKCSQSTQTLEIRSTKETPTTERTGKNGFDPECADLESFRLENESEKKRSSVSRQLFPLDSKTVHVPVLDNSIYESKHIRAACIIQAYARGYLVRRIMQTERVIALKNTYKEALHYMIKLHVDAPLDRSEFHFLHRLQLQCDAASMNIVELFAQSPAKRMQIIEQDREIKRSRIERPTSARSYSFATQRTLARKKMKEMGDYQPSSMSRSYSARSRCQTWTSDVKEKLISPNVLNQSIKRSTSAGTMRKPWR